MIAWVYSINALIVLAVIYVHWLDVRSTMRAVALGYIEGNPDMVKYVSPGRPWRMVRGKLVNGGWAVLVALLIPLVTPLVVWRAIGTWQAVRGNERNISLGPV